MATLSQLADYLINGYWCDEGSYDPHHFQVPGHVLTFNMDQLQTQEEKDTAVAALQLWQDVANVTLVQTSDLASINFTDDNDEISETTPFSIHCRLSLRPREHQLR